MWCVALMIHLPCFPYYYGGRRRTVTPGSCGCGITGEARQRNESMTGRVYGAVSPGALVRCTLGAV